MKKINIRTNLLASVLIVTIFVTFSMAHAAYVEKVKGKKALIFLDGMNVEKGDLVYTTDASDGRKTSILRITTVKDQKAIGELVKGQAKVDQGVIPRSAKTATKTKITQDSSHQAPRRHKNSQFAIGGLLALNFDSMDMNICNTAGANCEQVKASGTAFGVGGVLDYNMNSWFTLRGIVSYDGLKTDGTSTKGYCTGGSCTTTINYLTAMLWGKLNIIQKNTTAWVGLGGGVWYPIGKTSNAIDQTSISTTAAYAIGGGVDVGFSDTLYLPVQLEYGMLPKSTDVKTGYYSVRAGVMLKY